MPTTNQANKLGEESPHCLKYADQIHVNTNKEAKLFRNYGIRVAYIGKKFETYIGKDHQEII